MLKAVAHLRFDIEEAAAALMLLTELEGYVDRGALKRLANPSFVGPAIKTTHSGLLTKFLTTIARAYDRKQGSSRLCFEYVFETLGEQSEHDVLVFPTTVIWSAYLEARQRWHHVNDAIAPNYLLPAIAAIRLDESESLDEHLSKYKLRRVLKLHRDQRIAHNLHDKTSADVRGRDVLALYTAAVYMIERLSQLDEFKRENFGLWEDTVKYRARLFWAQFFGDENSSHGKEL